MRLRPELARTARPAGHRPDRGGLADALPHRRDRDVGGAARRLRRHRLHGRQVRRGLAPLARPAPAQLLPHLPDLRLRGALADRALVRLQPPEAHPLHLGGTADRVRDHLLGDGAAAHDRQARGRRLREERRRPGHPDRLFLQPRRHLHLPDHGRRLPGAGDQYAAHHFTSGRAVAGAPAGVERRRRRRWRGLRRARRHARLGRHHSGRERGVDPRDSSPDVRRSHPDQPRRQCGRDHRGREMGERARRGASAPGARRQAGLSQVGRSVG